MSSQLRHKCIKLCQYRNKDNYINIISVSLHWYFLIFQEKHLNLNRDTNSDLQISSLVFYHWGILVELPVHPEVQVRVRVPVQVQIFLLKYDNVNLQRHKVCLFLPNNLIWFYFSCMRKWIKLKYQYTIFSCLINLEFYKGLYNI